MKETRAFSDWRQPDPFCTELRFLHRQGYPPRLQYRTKKIGSHGGDYGGAYSGEWSEWRDIPVVEAE